MRRILAGLAVVALAAAACSSGDDDPPLEAGAQVTDPAETSTSAPVEPSPRVIRSEDGNAMVVVPAGDDTDITISVLDPADYPAFLDGAQTSPGTVVYDLGPDGATFDEPVRFFRRVQVADLGGDLEPLDVPIIALVSADDDGQVEHLAGQSVLRSGDTVWVGADFTHFSEGVTVNVQVDASTNELFGDLIRSVKTADGEPAVRIVAEQATPTPPPVDPAVTDVVIADDRLHFSMPVADVAGRSIEPAAAGAKSVITGGYLFPAEVDVDAHDTDEVDFHGRTDDDFFRPLILSFPGDLGVPGPTGAGVASIDATLDLDHPLFPEPFDVEVGVTVFEQGEFDRLVELLGGSPIDEPPVDDEVAPAEPVRYGESLFFESVIGHSGGPRNYPSETAHRAEVDSAAPGGLAALVSEYEGDVHVFTARQLVDGSAALVDFTPLVLAGEEVEGTTGIDCFCPFHVGLFVSPGEEPPPPQELQIRTNPDGSFTMVHNGTDALAPGTLFLSDADAVVLDVGPDEGPAFSGDARFDFEIPVELFADGFESGDVSAWSSTR